MKLRKYISYVLMTGMVMGTILLTSSCEEEDGVHIEDPNGSPEISYIRITDPEASDSLIVRANLGQGIVIVGQNLGGTRQVWFNDRQAVISPSWVTNRTILVNVPNVAPAEVTDRLYLVDAKGDTLAHEFEVTIPAPVVTSAKNEWPVEGENLVIRGEFFFAPMTITFTGGATGDVVNVTSTEVEVTVPEGATEGPVMVATNFGSVESTFHVWDSRNIVLDFDEKLANGWRIGMVESGDGVNGAYNVFRANLGPSGSGARSEGPSAPSESGLLFEFWGGAATPPRTENFYPYYPNSYRDYVLKFEAKVINWYGGYLNLCLSEPGHNGNNQEIWSNTYNARAIWGPWAEAGEEFTTGGQWITVVVPLTDFHYHMGTDANDVVVYTGDQSFVEANAGSFSAWLLGSPESNPDTEVEFYIDNIRFVQP